MDWSGSYTVVGINNQTMTLVIGQIESLTRLKETLTEKGIDRFDSIGDIKFFIKNYEKEKQEVINQTEFDLDIEIDTLQADGFRFQKNYNTSKTAVTKELNNIIFRLKLQSNIVQSRKPKNSTIKIYNWIQLKILETLNACLDKYSDKVIELYTFRNKKKVSKTFKRINYYNVNRNEIISSRCSSKLKRLAYIKEIVLGLENLISGAIGENLVVKELEKLSIEYFLFNDFSIDFERPIYYKEDKSKISSIQIDHLLVTNSGIFIIETKNWSKESIERHDFRSPIKQISRTGFAIYSTLTYSRELLEKLKRHHWGEKIVPVRKLVVMINQKPKEKFKFVKIVTLKELNRYITYFDPIFNNYEVNIIVEHLKILKTK